MVKLSDAPLIILEGDEYLASPLDPRPKFHIYKPQIALISGIAWDHINVFPSKEKYELQFKIFCELMEDVGTLVYNETDEAVREIAESESKRLFLLPYFFTEYQVKNGQTLINFNGREYELNIFGKHNLLNMEGARKICRRLGINNRMFFQAMKTFEGASNRLEVYLETEKGIVYRDFAHAPSKLEATVEAVKKNHPKNPLVAVFELHTYSSLSPEFLPEYKKTMDEADVPVVFYSPDTLKHKNLPPLSAKQVEKHFGLDKELKVFTDRKELEKFLLHLNYPKFNLLMMSSGTFDGLNFEAIVEKLFPKKEG
jgi:UDP-N-acetylmuramate: L-alanyl-gamma-D-glutamyl-meso-diaminopimelate ligase